MNTSTVKMTRDILYSACQKYIETLHWDGGAFLSMTLADYERKLAPLLPEGIEQPIELLDHEDNDDGDRGALIKFQNSIFYLRNEYHQGHCEYFFEDVVEMVESKVVISVYNPKINP